MSSPGRFLKKPRSNPLPQGKAKPKSQQFSLESFEDDSSSATIPQILGQPSPQSEAKKDQTQTKSEVTDSQLLISMASRLRLVEKELLTSKREIVEKNHHIHQLEEKLAQFQLELQVHNAETSTSGDHHLLRHCQALQKQVDEMEEFLNDYGMVWVGSGHAEKLIKDNESSAGLWHPEDSIVPDSHFSVDHDKVLKNIEILNSLAGEGSLKIESTSQRGTLKDQETIPLALFHNGIVLYNGPFRSFVEPSTRQFILDLTEGYFPSELQHRYPNGIPIKVQDRRDTWFQDRHSKEYFSGTGRPLGGLEGPSRLVPAGRELRNPPDGMKVTSELPGHKMSAEQLLSKLPQSIIKQGRVMDIRAGVRDIFKASDSPGVSVHLVDTPVLEELKLRLDLEEGSRPPTPSHITTIKVKAESGDQTYILKMKYSETVGDLWSHLIKQGMTSSSEYVLKTTFPSRVLDDYSAALLECGLVPTATVYVAKSTRT